MTSAKPLTFLFKDDGAVPNNATLPALVYKSALDLTAARSGSRDRATVRRQRLGPRPMAQRHLSVHALSFDDP